jgi:hypothetical protein
MRVSGILFGFLGRVSLAHFVVLTSTTIVLILLSWTTRSDG